MVFDALVRGKQVESIVMDGDKRKYYRFRWAHFYSPKGIITGDQVGCQLLCHWPSGRCWNFEKNANPEGVGDLYSPSQVALKLRALARKRGINLYRLSGAEPFLGERSTEHLIKVIEAIPDGDFVIETNGIFIGAKHGDLLRDLPENVSLIRICVKGQDARQFSAVTCAQESDFRYQVQAIKALKRSGIKYIMALAKGVVNPEILGYSIACEPFEFEVIRQYGRR